MRSVVLYGDSMLARFTKPRIDALEKRLDRATVHNCAAGGWTSDDCARRASVTARLRPDVLVLSLGMNDCAPWKLVPQDRFEANVRTVLEHFEGSRIVGFLPPPVVEQERPGLGTRTNEVLDRYRDSLRDLVGASACLETGDLLCGTPDGTLEPDGVHLTSVSYDALTPFLAELVNAAIAGSDGTSVTNMGGDVLSASSSPA
ncbi:SGNH/GDSL hydrolase family protein [Nocardioides sp. NPDC101246]|uniref:SGNH/GDSL hydrolase family protein n=1 Tax=Nocardioides sp. NPDC101246 TaxID=3364336 RepID=UPI00381BF6D7